MALGRVVILNGVSSAGKSTLATAFRDERARRGEFWMLLGIDDVLSKLTAEWYDVGLESGVGARAEEGLFFVRDGLTQRLGVGVLLRRLLVIYHDWVATAAMAGINVIVDEVVLDGPTYESWVRALDGLEVTWVAARCDPAIAAARESARGDRPLGMASAQHDVVHRGIPYAFEIDTGTLTPSQAHDELRRGLGV